MARTVEATGKGAGPGGDRLKHDATLVSVFCIPPAYDPTLTVDNNGDLPGPGAVSLPGQAQLLN